MAKILSFLLVLNMLSSVGIPGGAETETDLEVSQNEWNITTGKQAKMF